MVPERLDLSTVKVWRRNDTYIGRGSRQLSLAPSIWANPFKVRDFGRERAVALFVDHLWSDNKLLARLHELSAARLAVAWSRQYPCTWTPPPN